MTSLPAIIKNLFFFLIILLILVFGLISLRPYNLNNDYQIAGFRLASLSLGLALHSKDLPNYYNFSPHNDFLSTADQSYYQTLITKSDIIDDHYQKTIYPNFWQEHLSIIKNIFGLSYPQVSFTKDPTIISYSSNIKNSTITITETLKNYPNINRFSFLTTTLSYQCTDFVFDDQNLLYTNPSNQDINFFRQLYHRQLTPVSLPTQQSPSLWFPLNTDHLYIVNPDIPGHIQINRLPHQKILINPSFCLVGVQSALDTNPPSSTINLTIK